MRERSHFVDKVGEKLFPYASGVADFPHWRKGNTDCSMPFLGASAIVTRGVGSRDLKALFSFVYVYTYTCVHMGAWANVGCFLNWSPLPSFIQSLSLNLNLTDSGILAAQQGLLSLPAQRPSFWHGAGHQNSSPHACTASIFWWSHHPSQLCSIATIWALDHNIAQTSNNISSS